MNVAKRFYYELTVTRDGLYTTKCHISYFFISTKQPKGHEIRFFTQ